MALARIKHSGRSIKWVVVVWVKIQIVHKLQLVIDLHHKSLALLHHSHRSDGDAIALKGKRHWKALAWISSEVFCVPLKVEVFFRLKL